MKIVKIIGGLGNQMFQYAFSKELQFYGETIKIDKSEFKSYKLHNGFELDNIFKLNYDSANENEINKLSDNKKNIINKVKRKVIGRKQSHIIQKHAEFDKAYLNVEECYLDGYWQSEKYFKKSINSIKNEFVFIKQLESRNLKIIDEMKNCNSVSIHVRRGDYVTNKKDNEKFGGICTCDYFLNAISYMRDRIKDPVFYIFSDDIDWAKDNIKAEKSTFIDWNNGENSYKDMQLISNCKYNIISNSSFSWWGAYLNNYKNKLVISPKKWTNSDKTNNRDISPDTWIKL